MPDDIMALTGERRASVRGRGYADPDPDAEADPRSRTCPRCGGPLVRVRRRLIDRLLSLSGPLRRYRCHAIDCGWVGNMRPRDTVRGRPDSAANPDDPLQ